MAEGRVPELTPVGTSVVWPATRPAQAIQCFRRPHGIHAGSAGTTDAVPLADALALHSALVAHRVPTSLYVYPHGSHSWPGAQGRAALRRTEAFLRRWLV